MPTFTESRLEFVFDDNWRIEKWDGQPAYRTSGGFGSAGGTRGCDFLGHHASDGVFLIEAKNFTDHHHRNIDKLTSGQLADVMVEKVRDTLAGAVWIRGRSFDQPPVRSLVDETLGALTRSARAIRVVLWVEDLPQLRPAIATSMAQQISRCLVSWFGIARVVVTNRELNQRDPLPGLVVRPV